MRIVFLVPMLAALAVDAAELRLTPAEYGEAAIVIAEPVDDIRRVAADELRTHLQLITGHAFPVHEGAGGCRPCFHIGRVAPDDDAGPLREEEARYLVAEEAVYIYGDDELRVRGTTPLGSVIGSGPMRYNRVGTLFAVYMFLEEQLGVRWLEPGAEGVAYTPRDELRLPLSRSTWQSPFPYQRNLRSYAWRSADEPAVFLPDAFVLTTEQAQQRRAELEVWLRRMRMGARNSLGFGHAFHDWWDAYGETHPEYFALNGNGVREPLHRDRPDRVKMCVSNPGVVEQAVSDWLADREHSTLGRAALCVAVNDGGGGGAAEYCHCDACRALDVPHPDEPFGAHLTDRYMHLANEALVAARREVPEALVTAYAYAVTRMPPRRVRLQDGIVLQFVTAMGDPLPDTRAIYEGWQEMGAKAFMFRPNDLCVELGLPLGHEERIWAHQQVAVDMGARGTDHDSVHGLWTGISGLTYYVLARSHVDPGKPFEHWVDEYARSFGAAHAEVAAYVAHWRRKFDDTILPANGDVRSDGGRGFLRWNGLGGVSGRIRSFYDEGDFDHTDSLLAAGLERPVNAGQRRQLERLQLANRHNRLTFEAMAAVNEQDTLAIRQRATALLAFREETREQLRMNWRVLFSTQHQMGDATGITSLLIEPRVAARRRFAGVRATAAPVIDGVLDEPLWTTARLPVTLANNATAMPPRAATTAHVAWDGSNLYVGLRCVEPLMADLVEGVTTRDGAVWTDNAVEIFVDGAGTRRDFHQFILSSAGALLDGRKAKGIFDSSWDAALGDELEYRIAKDDDGWTAELRIAWTTLDMSAPRPGDVIRFNITRDRNVTVPGQSEASALSPTFGGFHAPARFADLELH